MSYDDVYSQNEDYFGMAPETTLRKHYHLLNAKKPVLDIGAGQGRHAIFLGREGYTVHALEPSRVGINTIYELSKIEHLPIRTINTDFTSFETPIDYGGILLFGLIQILSWSEIETLIERIELWSRAGAILFISAFLTSNPTYPEHAQKLTPAGKNSFVDSRLRYFTYLEPGEVLRIFPHTRVIFHWEGLGNEHQHGQGPRHRHAMVQAVLER
ncbi:hypothetical protein JXQ70_01585 [bacterium]|nr:hypothetical protein [bacterium]